MRRVEVRDGLIQRFPIWLAVTTECNIDIAANGDTRLLGADHDEAKRTTCGLESRWGMERKARGCIEGIGYFCNAE